MWNRIPLPSRRFVMGSVSPEVELGEAVKLFNVDHEHWEDVATGDAAPPDGALAFDVAAAVWISTKEGLDHVESSSTLRYTQHGLDLLRENGYEG